jgi:hypothetical protein
MLLLPPANWNYILNFTPLMVVFIETAIFVPLAKLRKLLVVAIVVCAIAVSFDMSIIVFGSIRVLAGITFDSSISFY